MEQPVRMIDGHVHFYDPDWPSGIVWPSVDQSFFGKRLPQDYFAFGPLDGFDQVIAIETSERPVDDERLRRLAEETPQIGGFVANLQPNQPGFADRVAAYSGSLKFKGVRLRPVEAFDLASPALLGTLRILSDYGLSIELGAKVPARLKDIAALAEALPDCAIVLTHAGHPRIDEPVPAQTWIDGIKAVGQHANTFVKLTPLRAFAGSVASARLLEACRAHVAVLLRIFGAQRIIFGSNWPVSEALGTPNAHAEFVMRCLPPDPEYADWIFDNTARRIYRL
ncbi:MAG: amidohydrolase family protein [Pseudomonadota bacterium]